MQQFNIPICKKMIFCYAFYHKKLIFFFFFGMIDPSASDSARRSLLCKVHHPAFGRLFRAPFALFGKFFTQNRRKLSISLGGFVNSLISVRSLFRQFLHSAQDGTVPLFIHHYKEGIS